LENSRALEEAGLVLVSPGLENRVVASEKNGGSLIVVVVAMTAPMSSGMLATTASQILGVVLIVNSTLEVHILEEVVATIGDLVDFVVGVLEGFGSVGLFRRGDLVPLDPAATNVNGHSFHDDRILFDSLELFFTFTSSLHRDLATFGVLENSRALEEAGLVLVSPGLENRVVASEKNGGSLIVVVVAMTAPMSSGMLATTASQILGVVLIVNSTHQVHILEEVVATIGDLVDFVVGVLERLGVVGLFGRGEFTPLDTATSRRNLNRFFNNIGVFNSRSRSNEKRHESWNNLHFNNR